MAAEKHGEAEAPKASDFVSIVIDFFAVLVPGAILAYSVRPVGKYIMDIFPWIPKIHGDSQGWVAFAVASYFLGHVVFAVGSLVMDPIEKVLPRIGSAISLLAKVAYEVLKWILCMVLLSPREPSWLGRASIVSGLVLTVLGSVLTVLVCWLAVRPLFFWSGIVLIWSGIVFVWLAKSPLPSLLGGACTWLAKRRPFTWLGSARTWLKEQQPSQTLFRRLDEIRKSRDEQLREKVSPPKELNPLGLTDAAKAVVWKNLGSNQDYKKVDYYSSSLSILRLLKPAAATTVDRIEAESKVFRSLAVLFTVAVGCLLVAIAYSPFKQVLADASTDTKLWVMVATAAILLVLSFWRFADLRRKSKKFNYTYLVALDHAETEQRRVDEQRPLLGLVTMPQPVTTMVILPRVDELNALPLRSQVAFAARCALRVHHLFKTEGPDAPDAQLEVKRAIETAGYFAADRTFAEIDDAVNKISGVARRLAERGGDYRKNSAARVALSAAFAAQAAKLAANELGPVGVDAEAAARMMVEAVSIAEPGQADAAIKASRCDFDKLAALASGQSSEPGGPIDIGENGPLGPLWA